MSKKKNLKNTPHLDKIPAKDKFIGFVLISAIALIPLLLRCKVVDYIAPKMINPILNTGIQTNVFTYYKYVFLLIITAICLAGLIYKILFTQYSIKKSYINPWLLIIIFVILMTTLGAEYKSIALFGTYDRNEGAVTYLCYFVIFFVAANIIISSQYRKYVNVALALFIIPNFALAVFQLAGFDFLNTNFMHSLILPMEVASSMLTGKLAFTLENPNYVSGLFGPLSAYFIAMTILESERAKRIFNSILLVSSLTVLLVSKSMSGLVALFAVIPFLLVFIYIYHIKNKKKYLLNIGAIFIAILLLLGGLSKLDSGIAWQIKSSVYNRSASSAKNDISNGRLYIWDKTIRLIAEKPIMGHGAGTLAYYFPKYEKGKSIFWFNENWLVNKAHNWYLDSCFAFGILFFIAMLGLILMHIINTWPTITSINNSSWTLALFIFFIAYLVQWLFNDSTIGSSTVFWIMWGFAVSINLNGITEGKTKKYHK